MALHILLPPLPFILSLLTVATLEAKASFKSTKQIACSLAKIRLHERDIKAMDTREGLLLGFFPPCTFNDTED